MKRRPSALYDFVRTIDLLLGAKSLSPDEIQQLEQQTEQRPNDCEARVRLLGVYWAAKDSAAREMRRKHVLWVIEHHPASALAGQPYVEMDPVKDGDAYIEAEQMWRRQVERFPDDTRILSNAAEFFLRKNRKLSEEYLRKCAALEPTKPQWPERLSSLHQLAQIGGGRSESSEEAQAAVVEIEKALSLTGPRSNSTHLRVSAAKAAFAAGEYEKAKAYAAELLQSPGPSRDWNYGNVVHHGNLILGRVALKEGNLGKAREYLLAAGKTPGSPQLDSFGPNMSLAKELLEQGDHDTVLEYLKLCARFWKRQEVQDWISEVQSGRAPNFGTNLYY